MRVAEQPAFILHRYDYGEASLLLEVFSRDHGRVGLVAKGARRAKSGHRALLNPFQPLLLDWSGGGDLFTLTRVDTEAAAFPLAGRGLFCAFYLNELMLRLLQRQDPHDGVHALYAQTLAQLAQGEEELEVSLRLFEKRLLEAVGYGLVLERDARTGAPIDPVAEYAYLAELGPVRAAAASAGVRVRGATLLGLAAETLADETVLKESKALLRQVLSRYIGAKPLNSGRLFRPRRSGANEGHHG